MVALSAELGMAVPVNVYPDATSERDALAALMTPDQIAEAQRLSREFQPHTESAAEAAAKTPAKVVPRCGLEPQTN